jgi:hypothetical protein
MTKCAFNQTCTATLDLANFLSIACPSQMTITAYSFKVLPFAPGTFANSRI